VSDDPNGIVALGPWSSLVNDPDADGTLGWSAMDEVARATAVLAALRASFPIDTEKMRWDPGRRIAFAWRKSPLAPERRQLAMEYAPPGVALAVVMEMISAGHGRKVAEDSAALVSPPRRRWLPGRKKR
jgi:hypothetical protein